jgi:hypothetical protein
MYGAAGNYVIVNTPFHTVGAAGVTDVYLAADDNGKSTSSLYYGVTAIRVAGVATSFNASTIDVDRLDSGGSIVGNYYFPDSHGFCHFAAQKDGRFRVNSVGGFAASTSSLQMLVSNAWRSTDSFVFSFPFNATVSTAVMSYEGGGSPVAMSAVGSLAAIDAASSLSYWNDTASQRIWVKYWCALAADVAAANDTDSELFRYRQLRFN